MSSIRIDWRLEFVPDVAITVERVTPIRPAADAVQYGVVFTQDTLPNGGSPVARNIVKALLHLLNLNYVGMHSHQFGASGPFTNADRAAGLSYATRNRWSGWPAWDARMQLMRDCAGAGTELFINLLPPGHLMMDGGSKTNASADPLKRGRTWDNIDDPETRHTDLHRADMIDIAKAIVGRHADVTKLSCWNELKGNFMPPDNPTEISANGLSNTMNYIEQKRYQEALRTGLDSVRAGVEIWGPYYILERNGVDALAAQYGAIGFPQPAMSADATHYRQYYATGAPLFARNKTLLEYFLANVNAAARTDWLAIDIKTLGADNDPANWNVLYPWRWYLFDGLRAQLQALKSIAGYVAGVTKTIAMESYPRKVLDENNVPSDAEQGALCAEMLRVELIERLKAHLRWAPEQGATKANRLNLFTSTMSAGGGQPLPAYYAYKYFCDSFRGVDVYDTVSSDRHSVTAVSNPTETLLINHTPDTLTVTVNAGALIMLTPYEVKLVAA